MNHTKSELRQMQSMSLEYKILATQERIKAWYEGWTRFNIRNLATGDERFETIDTRDYCAEPKIGDDEMIESAYPGQVYVSFSGGKDSTVLLDLARRIYPDIPAVFVDTGLEYPELREFVKGFENVVWLKPQMNFRQVIQKYGYPLISKDVANTLKGGHKPGSYRWKKLHGEVFLKNGKPSKFNCVKWKFLLDAPFKVSDECCDVMKKRPLHKYQKETGQRPIVATMADESMMRKNSWIKYGCNAFDRASGPQSRPMSFWTEQDVLEYIKTFGVAYASVYGDIVETEHGLDTTKCKRTGCVFCGFGCHLEKEPNRFQRLQVTHPALYNYCMKPWEKGGLGMKEPLEYIGIQTENKEANNDTFSK